MLAAIEVEPRAPVVGHRDGHVAPLGPAGRIPTPACASFVLDAVSKVRSRQARALPAVESRVCCDRISPTAVTVHGALKV